MGRRWIGMVFPSENRLGGRRLPLSHSIVLFDGQDNPLGDVLDLSQGGLRLSTPRLLPLNRPTSVILHAPAGPITLRGILVWARKGDLPRTFQMGMRFERLSQDAINGIEAMLDQSDAETRSSEKAG